MANLLPTVDISGTISLVYDIQVEGKRNKFYVLYTTFTVFKFVVYRIPTVLFRYLFHKETATLKL